MGAASVLTSLYRECVQSVLGCNKALPCKLTSRLVPIVVYTGCKSFLTGIAISNTLVPAGQSVDSMQYTTGPRFTATWLRVSSTSGLVSINVTGISRSSSMTSPAFQVRFNSAYCAAVVAMETG